MYQEFKYSEVHHYQSMLQKIKHLVCSVARRRVERLLPICEHMSVPLVASHCHSRCPTHAQEEEAMAPTLVLLPGKSHGRRSLVGCSLWVREDWDRTERLHFHFSLSCIGEGNGSPMQCSCLENPRDGGAWRVAVCGVAQSWTRRKRFSSSSSMHKSLLSSRLHLLSQYNHT